MYAQSPMLSGAIETHKRTIRYGCPVRTGAAAICTKTAEGGGGMRKGFGRHHPFLECDSRFISCSTALPTVIARRRKSAWCLCNLQTASASGLNIGASGIWLPNHHFYVSFLFVDSAPPPIYLLRYDWWKTLAAPPCYQTEQQQAQG